MFAISKRLPLSFFTNTKMVGFDFYMLYIYFDGNPMLQVFVLGLGVFKCFVTFDDKIMSNFFMH